MAVVNLKKMTRQIDLQNKEFAAVSELSRRYSGIQRVPVVDDEYPEVHHRYEGALADLIAAMHANGRFDDPVILARLGLRKA